MENNIVLIAYDDTEIQDKKLVTELFFQGNLTLKNRKKMSANVKNEVFCFNSKTNKKSLLNIKDDINSIYIVGHHDFFLNIGLHNTVGFTPEKIADKLNDELKDKIKNIKYIYFFVCNSALEHEGESYCSLFYKYMKNKYKCNNLIVGGFIGFLFEDPIKKRTYLSKDYGCYDKIYRADDNIILFGNHQ